MVITSIYALSNVEQLNQLLSVLVIITIVINGIYGIGCILQANYDEALGCIFPILFLAGVGFGCHYLFFEKIWWDLLILFSPWILLVLLWIHARLQ